MRVASRKTLLGELALAAVAAAVCASGARAAEPVPSNLDLMARLTSEVASELYGKFAPTVANRTVEVRPLGNSEDYLFVGNIFTTRLSEVGVRITRSARPMAAPHSGNPALDSLQTTVPDVMESPAAPPAGDLVLQFQNVAFKVAYPDAYRSHLIGGKKLKRTATVRVFATLTETATGQVVWTGESERSAADEFGTDDASRVEYGNYLFVQPEPPSSGWGKYVEPVFVTGIVVGLIYLFFSNQSGN